MKSFKLISLALLVLVWTGFVLAQEETEVIPAELALVAQELGCDTRSECAVAFDQNFNEAVQIAIKHDVYQDDPEKQNLADTYQKEVLARIANISAENMEEEIIRIAKDLIAKKPALARDLGA